MSRAADRVFDETRSPYRVYVTSRFGITVLEVSGDRLEGFKLARECTARDAAVTGREVAVATETDVLVGADETYVKTGFGPAVAVGGDPVSAAGPDGRVARREADGWSELGHLDATVTAIDGNLVGTDEGVYRVDGDGLEHVGLADVADVSTTGVPYAATRTGLYKLGAGWMQVLEGEFELVAADRASASPGLLGRAHAATADRLFEYDDEEWGPWHIPVAEPVVGLDYGEAIYSVSQDGTFLAVEDGEWRTRNLGLSGVTGLAVVEAGEENA